MKKVIFGLLICLGAFAVPKQSNAQVSVSFQVFYDQLSPYGMWINNPTYGYVWVPNVSVGFQPYASDGYWTYTEWGWTWVSSYNWGWAPFHYGRWYNDPFYGYTWIPGNDWGPAWVSWRHCDGYYGWAPLGPGISYGASYATYNPPSDRWIFVRERDFGRTNINNYALDKVTNVTIIRNSTIINNTTINKSRGETYIAGPDRVQVQKLSGRDVKPIAVQDNASPGKPQINNNQLGVYRPKINAGGKAAPGKVYSASEAKPIIEQRNSGNRVNLNTGQQAKPGAATPQNIRNNKVAGPKSSPQEMDQRKIRTNTPAQQNPQQRVPQAQPRQRVNTNTAPVQQNRVNTNAPRQTEQPVRRAPVNDDVYQQAPPQQNRIDIQQQQAPPQQNRMDIQQQQAPQQQERINTSPPPQQQPRQMEQPRMSPPPQQQPQQRINVNPPPQQPQGNPGGRVPVRGGPR